MQDRIRMLPVLFYSSICATAGMKCFYFILRRFPALFLFEFIKVGNLIKFINCISNMPMNIAFILNKATKKIIIFTSHYLPTLASQALA